MEEETKFETEATPGLAVCANCENSGKDCSVCKKAEIV